MLNAHSLTKARRQEKQFRQRRGFSAAVNLSELDFLPAGVAPTLEVTSCLIVN